VFNVAVYILHMPQSVPGSCVLDRFRFVLKAP